MKPIDLDFVFVEEHKNRFPITELIGIVQNLSRAGYYKRLKKDPAQSQTERDQALLKQMLSLYVTHGGNLGHERFKLELENVYTHIVSLKRIRRMREMYRMPLKTARRKPRPAGSGHAVIDNLLNRNFKAMRPGLKFSVDISYLEVKKPFRDFIYLCAILDLYNNEIVAYTISDTLDVDFVLEAVRQLEARGFEKEALLHSDQGIQFTSHSYQGLLKKMELTQSMSRRGNCWDNAPIESFFGKLKTEMPGFTVPETAAQMRAAVAAYITYYNETRPQLKLGASPVTYRNLQARAA
ncbi:IS3 family transposase [Planococcus liqunii]|uniref:IS3 family transposase n=1 Tax=Planococcus liqunii TaxID=3058394 RepID=UPI00263129AD|nr:IS3 family transposase [Planococcus sp. N056]WKA50663.1 IS3 family transposase [Planococcus sp. N056]WKA51811.1 IS3 family transposase [Planococcus sp. N056]WKA51820.1 IS3 family transposase [Planococcus sp. N056]WKA52466.1 IS3 family transposase [Planococcus sp. N056]WKA52468.1 IS3 family transposase [Planococcus sp. N056]